MDADLDLLLIAVYCTAHDLLPIRAENARRILTDAEVVTLCVAQQLLGISSDEKFWAGVHKRLGHLFPRLIQRPGFVKRRQRLSDTIEALTMEFARHSPGLEDDLLVVDSTPVECGRSVETMRRSALADAADYGYCASHVQHREALASALQAVEEQLSKLPDREHTVLIERRQDLAVTVRQPGGEHARLAANRRRIQGLPPICRGVELSP